MKIRYICGTYICETLIAVVALFSLGLALFQHAQIRDLKATTEHLRLMVDTHQTLHSTHDEVHRLLQEQQDIMDSIRD